jgi:hypothetical protein
MAKGTFIMADRAVGGCIRRDGYFFIDGRGKVFYLGAAQPKVIEGEMSVLWL